MIPNDDFVIFRDQIFDRHMQVGNFFERGANDPPKNGFRNRISSKYFLKWF